MCVVIRVWCGWLLRFGVYSYWVWCVWLLGLVCVVIGVWCMWILGFNVCGYWGLVCVDIGV